MICVRCGSHLWEADKPIRCPHCKTLNQPLPKPELKIEPKPIKYQSTRSEYQPKATPQVQNIEPRVQDTVVKKTVGLGDAIEKVTKVLGIPTCGGCGQRKTTFNQAVPDILHPWRR